MNGNEDKTKGTMDDVKGRAQEAIGDLTGNEDTQAEGQANQVKGKGEKFTGDVKNAVNDLTN